MRVVFVALGYEQLSIGMLAAILRRHGHHVGVAFSRHLFDDRAFLHNPTLSRIFQNDDVHDQINAFQPDVICFSSLTTTHQWMLETARRAKEATGAITVFGGVHPSAVPEVVIEQDGVDYVVVGEGDVALPLLLSALKSGTVDRPLPNVVFRGEGGEIVRGPVMPFFPDLDALPYYDKDIWVGHVPVGNPYIAQSARGCPYRCTFCFNNFFANLPGPKSKAGRYVRQRSVDHFVGELKLAKKRFGIKYVDIIDDIFTLDTRWIVEFSHKYRREVGLPFVCLSHPKFIDAERVKALKEAGCDWITIGVESADDSYKKSIKRVDSEVDIDRTLNLIESAGIQIKTDHIFGLVGEPDNAQEIARSLYSRHRLSRIGTFWLTYLPGTEIVQQGLEAGTITTQEAEEINNGSTMFFRREKNVSDEGRRRLYAAYEFLFRLMPLLPKGALEDIDAKALSRIPIGLLRNVGFLADVVNVVGRRNWEVRRVASTYSLGFVNHLLGRLGRPYYERAPAEMGAPINEPAWRRTFQVFADALIASVDESKPQEPQRSSQQSVRLPIAANA